MTRRRCFLSFSALLLVASALLAEAPAATTPEFVGLSSERLQRLSAAMQRYVDEGRVAGIVTYVARNGRVAHLEAFGKADVESGRPMKTDTVFRIASQTKAFTSVAVMMLVEEGKIGLADPVSRFIPAFAKTTVALPPPPAGTAADSPASVVSAKRPITIRDLLTHTAGIGYGDGPAAAQWQAAGIQGWYLADRGEPVSAVVERMAALPMDAQPGERFVYGYSADILGVVVERASGLTLAEFFRQRITAPLGLIDTQFYLPPAQRDRLAAVYAVVDGRIERATDPRTGQGQYVDGPRVAFSGGAGLLSTARDYGRFLQMLLNGGELDGVRLLGPKTVELMTVNHVGSRLAEVWDRPGRGFGLGFEVVEDVGQTGRHGSVGVFGWGGAYHTMYWVDPQERLVALLMTQLLPAGDSDLHETFRTLVYQAIVGPPAAGARP